MTIFGIIVTGLALIASSCGDDDSTAPIEIDVVASSGNTINMDGNWYSGCVNLNGNSAEEVFTFNGQDVTIEIDFFSGAGCQGNPAQSQTIKLDIMHVGETYNVSLDGNQVLANKISGTESTVGEQGSETFKQGFYIDDSGAAPKLYHGIFGDDGGALTTDGYPLELHNIAITRQ